MHFEVLVEDASGKIALEHIIEKILGPNGQDHTFRIISYKGVGRIPKNLRGTVYIDVDTNHSKSFQVFRDGIRNLAGMTT